MKQRTKINISQENIDYSTIDSSLLKRTNVAAVILNSNNEFLICRRSKDKKFLPKVWHFPGGKVEDTETKVEALKRELFEELDIKNISNIFSLNISHTYSVKNEIHRTIFYFCETINKPLLNNFENDQIKFVKLNSLQKYINDKSTQIVIEIAKKAIIHKTSNNDH